LETAGNEPLSRIDRKAIIAGRERRAHTPFQARQAACPSGSYYHRHGKDRHSGRHSDAA
jgi:hypothetical protein